MRPSFLALLPALALLAACGDKDDEAGEFDAILAISGDSEAGATVYANNCSACHGADGSGVTGPSMFDVVPAYSDEEILDVVFHGSGGMPAISLGDQDAADLLVYLGDTFE